MRTIRNEKPVAGEFGRVVLFRHFLPSPRLASHSLLFSSAVVSLVTYNERKQPKGRMRKEAQRRKQEGERRKKEKGQRKKGEGRRKKEEARRKQGGSRKTEARIIKKHKKIRKKEGRRMRVRSDEKKHYPSEFARGWFSFIT